MRSRTGRIADGFQREEREGREQRIERFIGRYLEGTDDGRLEAVLMVARSNESPVARALIATAADLSARGLRARIILANDDVPLEAGSNRSAVDALVREVRAIRDPRLLDGHEQLVLGERFVWFGDSMRRDPLQRDAYESFSADDRTAARLVRGVFERLWQLTLPLRPETSGVGPPPACFRPSPSRALRGE